MSKFNWTPNRDVNLIGLGGSPEVLGALTQGRFPAGLLTAPTTHLATRMGFREIFDLASLAFAQMQQLTSMMIHGVFERFPGVVGYPI